MLSLFNSHSQDGQRRDGFTSIVAKLSEATSWLRPGLPPATLEKFSSTLFTLTDSLDTMVARVENRFVQLGDDLQDLYRSTTDRTSHDMAMVEQISSQSENNILHRLESVIQDAQERLGKCRSGVQGKLGLVQEELGQLEKFSSMCDELEQIAQVMRIIGLSVGVESARSPEAVEMFTIESQEIKKFSEVILEIKDQIQTDAKAAFDLLITAQHQISESNESLGELAESAGAIVDETFQGIEKLMERSMATLEEAGQHSQEISSQVGELVMNIQFHDRMKQKVEHINEGLVDVAQDLEDTSSLRNGSLRELLGKDHAIISLQVAQLEKITGELSDLYIGNDASFGEISDRVDQLSNSLATLADSSHCQANGGKNQEPFCALQAGLDNLLDILSQGDSLEEQIYLASEQAAQSVNAILGYMEKLHDISFNTRLKSLNSIVKAEHLGEKGFTIAVLANEITLLSERTDTFVTNMDVINQSIAATTQKLVSSRDDVEEEHTSDTAALKIQIEGIFKDFKAFSENSATAIDQAEILKQSIGISRGGLRFLPDLSERFNIVNKQIKKIMMELEPWADRAAMVTTDSNDLAQRYTMEEERELHTQFLSGDDETIDLFEETPALPAPEEFTSSGQTEEELGDNIEFF